MAFRNYCIEFRDEWNELTRNERFKYIVVIILAVGNGLAGIYFAVRFCLDLGNFKWVAASLVCQVSMISTKFLVWRDKTEKKDNG